MEKIVIESDSDGKTVLTKVVPQPTKYKQSVNVKKLISTIKNYPIIYQTNHDSYRDSNGRTCIWEEIAMQMECSEKVCKAKWRACRDQYAREIKRFGSNVAQKSRWKYAKELEFLRPYTLKRVYHKYKNRANNDMLDEDSLNKTAEEVPEISAEMQFETDLINEIRNNESLYNTHHQSYRKFESKKLVWEKISLKMDKTENQCRLKWKALRDQYSREAKRISCTEDPDSTPKWKHYESLKFLEKYVKLK